MVRLYNSHHHSCFLYLASILVDEYGSESDCIGGLISMLEALLPRAFQLLQETQGFCHNPDTVDDLFRLFARFLQRNPAVFLQSPALPAVFDCALQAATLDHRDANASVMQFLSELIHTTRTREVVCWFYIVVADVEYFFFFFAGEIVARAPRSSLVGNPSPKGPCTHQYSDHRFDFFVVYLLSTQRGRCSTWIHASRPTGELSSSVDPKLSVLIPDVFLNGTEHFQLDGADIGKYPTTITGRVCSCPTRTAARLPP